MGALTPGVFHCLVCSGFSSDSLESVEQHLGAPRPLPQSEWCSLVAGGCHCRLCAYTTPLRANFSLHCQTDRHRARYQLAAHLREGGDRAPEEVAALVAKGNPVQLRCNLCDYMTSSLEKLRGHAISAHHEASVRVYRVSTHTHTQTLVSLMRNKPMSEILYDVIICVSRLTFISVV